MIALLKKMSQTTKTQKTIKCNIYLFEFLIIIMQYFSNSAGIDAGPYWLGSHVLWGPSWKKLSTHGFWHWLHLW